MYLLRENKLIEVDTTEDKHHGIRAVQLVIIPSTIVITKQVNNMVTEFTKTYTLHYELDGYIFRDPVTNRRLGGHCLTIGDAIIMALNLKYRVYNDDVEIIRNPKN